MTETTQLGLPIYGENDVPLWTNTNDGFEALDSLVNSCSAVQLDWGNPIHTFTDGAPWTATEDCWLCGVSRGTSGTLYVNGSNLITSGIGELAILPPTRIRKGDVVTTVPMAISAFRGTVVSGNTYVFNEAQVTLDYANPLFTFGTNNLSYTATKKCYLLGIIPGLWDNNVTLSIDGTVVYQATYSNGVGQGKVIPILTIEKGSTVSLNRWAGSVDCLHIFDGTVTGSVDAFKREVQRNYYFGLQNGAPVDIDISPLKDTEEITISVEFAPGNTWISERVSVSTAKTYNAHILNSQTSVGASVTYVNGKLQFTATNTSYSVMVWVTFN